MKELEQRGYGHIKHLAVGGEGNVYTCEKDGVKYLVKVIAVLEPEQLDVLKNINALQNKYFPRIEEIIHSVENTIIIREYIEGNALADEIKKNRVFSYNRAKEIILDVCNALRVLHAMKPHPVIYRDLKPENIIITPSGRVKLIDFGTSRYYKQESMRDTVLAGTNGYTAPEVMAGMQSDERSDIYSIGLLLYELLSGKSLQDSPYQIRPVAENNKYVPEYIDEIIEKATNINQTNRYATIDEFIYELENIKEIKESQKRKKKKKIILTAASVTAALVVIAVFLVTVFSGDKYETLLDLEFDDEQDMHYIGNSGYPEGQFEFSNGMLNVIYNGCSLEYKPINGMLVHFRLKSSGSGAIMLGQYRINTSLGFDCAYYDDEQNRDISTHEIQLSGMPIVNSGQWLDCILYTNEQNSAVYAIVCDNETKSIAYTAFQIPEIFNKDVLYSQIDGTFSVNMVTFFENENDYMLIDSVNIAQGSLKQYVKENMAAYEKHHSKVDSFLSQNITELPEIDFVRGD
jgi:serine/threonine protein kinase